MIQIKHLLNQKKMKFQLLNHQKEINKHMNLINKKNK